MSTRTALSYPEKKETLSIEYKTQGLSIESKTEKTDELNFGISELRERGNRFPDSTTHWRPVGEH